MKKLFLFTLLSILFATNSYCQQAKKPTIMVVPDKDWCERNHYTDELGNPDYLKALKDENMSGLITVMGDIMAGMNYKLTDLRSSLEKNNKAEGLKMVLKSKDNKGEITESDLNRAVREAKADILIQLSYKLEGAIRSSVQFQVKSIDPATSKQISGEIGNGRYSSAPIPTLLNEAVEGFMPNFCSKLDLYFNDIIDNGREGNVTFLIAEDCPYNFDSDITYNGETGELSELIEYWLNENTINGAFNLSNSSDVQLDFVEVRFPLFGKQTFGGQKALDMNGFMKPIEKFLSQFNISCKFQPDGIGMVYIVLGSNLKE